MESNDYNGGFEHFLKEKADQYKLYPTDRIWSAINDKLHARNKWPYFFVAAIFIGLGIGGNIYDSSIASGTAGKDKRNNLPAQGTLADIIKTATTTGNSRKIAEDPAISKLRVAYVNRDVIGGKGTTTSVGSSDLKSNEESPVSLASLIPANQSDVTGSEESLSPSTGKSEAGALIINEKIYLPATINLPKKSAGSGKLVVESKKSSPKTTAIRVLKPYKNKFGLQFYVAPTVSYRRLSGHGIKTFNNFNGNYNYSGDVNNIVDQQPLVGTELGAAIVFSMNKKVRFKTGLQFNFSQYETQAYKSTAELVPMTAAGIGHSQINAMSTFRSASGPDKTSLRNQRMMIAIPIGAEWSVYHRKNVQFNLAGSIQPTYVINNQSYMISSDLKNYAQAPALYRHFNMNSAVEAFVSFKTGSTKWSVGPQIRYQLLSSFKKEYPISEHLVDYGFKIGVTKTIK